MSSVYTTSREHFEQRMRARRAVTCLAVARTAIANGRLIEAIDRLEEACSLNPDADEARLLLEELRLQEAADPTVDLDETRSAPRSELAGWSHWLAAAIAICALAALAFLWPQARPAPGREVTPATQQPSAAPDTARTLTDEAPSTGRTAELPPSAATSGHAGEAGAPPWTDAPLAGAGNEGSRSPAAAPQPAITQALPIVPRDKATADEVSGAAAARAVLPSPEQAPSSQAGAGFPTPATPSPGSSSSPSSPALPLPPLDRATVMADDPSKLVPAEAVSASPLSAPATRPADVPEEASLRTPVGDTGEIAETLHRYADAYARLDATAARAVWPTVDQRALARAFDGLESQGLTFDHCDVVVAGAAATATCRGRARYVPKVGSREPLVERRQWTFRLRKAESGWEIVQAEAR